MAVSELSGYIWRMAVKSVKYVFLTYESNGLFGFRGDSKDFTVFIVDSNYDKFDDDMVELSSIDFNDFACVVICDRSADAVYLHGDVPEGSIGDVIRQWVEYA